MKLKIEKQENQKNKKTKKFGSHQTYTFTTKTLLNFHLNQGCQQSIRLTLWTKFTRT